MRFRRMMVSVVAFWMVAMLLPASASAQFRLRVEDMSAGGKGIVITDVGVGDIFASFDIIDPAHPSPLDPLYNVVTSSVTIGEARGAISLDPGQLAKLTMNEITVTSSGPAILKLTLEDTGYVNAANVVSNHVYDGQWQALWGVATPAGSSVQISSWANASNVAPDLGADQATPGVLSAIPGYTGASSSQTFNSADGPTFGSTIADHTSDTTAEFHGVGPLGYSLWSEVLITFSGAGSLSFYHDTFTSFDAKLVDTPEPGSLMLIGTGVVALAARMRRRKLIRA